MTPAAAIDSGYARSSDQQAKPALVGWLPAFECRGCDPCPRQFSACGESFPSGLVWLVAGLLKKKKKVNNCNVEGGKEEANLRLSFFLFLAGKNTDNFHADRVKSLFLAGKKVKD